MSALRLARIGDHAEHGSLFEGRDGVGDEGTGRDVAGNGVRHRCLRKSHFTVAAVVGIFETPAGPLYAIERFVAVLKAGTKAILECQDHHRPSCRCWLPQLAVQRSRAIRGGAGDVCGGACLGCLGAG